MQTACSAHNYSTFIHFPYAAYSFSASGSLQMYLVLSETVDWQAVLVDKLTNDLHVHTHMHTCTCALSLSLSHTHTHTDTLSVCLSVCLSL